ncbi:hypothetical protein B0T19DRAFT_113873 [Cercophora scortea]|uniref:Uncharacterized protein n=1 Tax=Cercophora scortea TaxID=314031 RepID=A0AAE0MHR4_9PEZI|nr:hypothetical protein B0T19DRAFT_113873 [Cercophora scortea]
MLGQASRWVRGTVTRHILLWPRAAFVAIAILLRCVYHPPHGGGFNPHCGRCALPASNKLHRCRASSKCSVGSLSWSFRRANDKILARRPAGVVWTIASSLPIRLIVAFGGTDICEGRIGCPIHFPFLPPNGLCFSPTQPSIPCPSPDGAATWSSPPPPGWHRPNACLAAAWVSPRAHWPV